MPLLMLKDLPRYECLLQAARKYPSLDASAADAYLHLLHTGDEVFALKSKFLQERGISQGRLTVMMILNDPHRGVMTPASLAEASDVTRATMTGLLDTLEKDKLIVREQDKEDRRTVIVRLTPKGTALIEGLLPDYFRLVAAMMSGLDEVERTQLTTLLKKIQGAVLEHLPDVENHSEALPAAV
jgi:DNA-binding MarR family transcriptional regulator